MTKTFDTSLNHGIEFIIKRSESLVEPKIKNQINQFCLNISKKQYSSIQKNSKTNDPYKFVLTLKQRLDYRSSNETAALQNLSIY